MSLTEEAWLDARHSVSAIWEKEVRHLIPDALVERMEKAFKDEEAALARWHALMWDEIKNRRDG